MANETGVGMSTGVEWRAVDAPCPLCFSRTFDFVGMRGGSAHRSGVGIAVAIVKCTNCELLYTSPTLRPVGNPYANEKSDDYFVHVNGEVNIAEGRRYSAQAEKLLGRTGSMLEVGCGLGHFLEGARANGWSVRGLDMTPEYVEAGRARGLDVELSDIAGSTYLREQYDCILMLNILEHVYDPKETLERIFAALKPGGLVVLGVPNELGLTARIGNLYLRGRGRTWSMNMSPTFAPFHVIGFSKKSLRFGLEQAGFEIVSLVATRGYNDMEKPTSLKRRVEYYGLSAVLKTADLLSMGDALNCWARRP